NRPKETLLPSLGDLYKLALASTVQIEKLDPNGKALRHASGFFSKQGQVVTTFRVIDGATTLRLRLPDGRQVPADRVLAWNRRQAWVILGVDAEVPTLKIADSKSWNVGDPCYWLDAKSDASRILSQGQIVGMQPHASWGDRIDISGGHSSSAAGGPLLNERGQAIGILGGIRPEALIARITSTTEIEAVELYDSTDSGTSVAISLLPQTLPPQFVTLKDLWTKGEMMPPVTNSGYVSYGSLG